ncbi:oxidative phosphorylation uncoupler [Aureococcus anophagefferens]|nr:oxidative phosphorylation uncoupler [Aureococcus anophagefferens]
MAPPLYLQACVRRPPLRAAFLAVARPRFAAPARRAARPSAPAALQLLLPGGPSARPDPRRSARTAAAAAAVHASPQVGAAGASAVATVTRGSAPRTSPPRAVTPRAARRFIHPIDVVKTRLQVSGGAIGGVIGSAMKNEGPLAFYKGINAAWLREASYTSLRLGLYEPIKGVVGAKDKDAHFLKKFAAGCLAGAIGSLVGNPFDVLKTRMMASTEGTSFGAEAKSLMESQGVAGFYRGIDANISRAMVLNGTKMACYDGAAPWRGSGARDGRAPQVQAGRRTVAPFDMVRTKLMNQPPDKIEFTGFVDCFVKVVKKDGPGGLYRGFFPIWARFAPTTTLQLIFFERFRAALGMDSL